MVASVLPSLWAALLPLSVAPGPPANPNWKACAVLATLPADMRSDEPLDTRQRFEIRQCWGHLVVVTAYERGEATPALVFSTGDDYPRYLAHSYNVLILQSLGGASDHVYVLAFRSGKPSVALKTATKDLIEVRQTGKSIVVLVPPTTYPGPDGRFPPSPRPVPHTFPLED